MNKFKIKVLAKISSAKNDKTKLILPIKDEKEKTIAHLRSLTSKSLDSKREISLLAKWRRENNFAFPPSQNRITLKSTKKWLGGQLLKNETRILFFIESSHKVSKPIGHMGLYSFDFREESCEIDNVIRGEKKALKGVMSMALKRLIAWTKKEMRPKKIYLRVLSTNKNAINFYLKNSFKKAGLIPIEKTNKFFLKMVYEKKP